MEDGMNRRTHLVVAGLLTAGLMTGAAVTRADGQDSQIDLNAANAMRLALDERVGQRIRLKLVSGQDIEGQVARVGSQAVVLTQLTGLEFYDGTVRLDQIAAVIVRVRGK
jgi:hypothetical protein